jgi:DNA-binding NarL/FixJ family response regulator
VVRILIVDDHAEVRSGLAELFAATADIVVVATAADGEEAVALAASYRPEVVVIDISMPGIDGIEATRRILAADPRVRVIVLTSYRDRYAEAIAAGADRYLLKEGEPAELLSAVHSSISHD